MHADLAILTDLGLIFTVAVAMALLFVRLRLPPVLAYVGAGVLLGPPGLGLADRAGALELLAELGVVLLLFTVGLEFSLAELRRSWRAVLVGGGLQVGLTVLVAAGLCMGAGLSAAEGVTWGFLASLSSTAVVLRQLDQRGETRAAHGRLVVGILIFQDLCVVPMMLLLPLLGGQEGGLVGLLGVLARAVLLVGGILVVARFGVPPLLRLVARSQSREMFLLAILAIAGLTAWATSLTGLSLALGGFLAGVVLAETQYAHQALAEVQPLRTVMMCVFFVTIGMLLVPSAIFEAPHVVLGMFLAVTLGKFFLAFGSGLLVRAPVRAAALAGAALAQVGEFSLVLSGAAVQQGILSEQDERRFLAAAILSIATAPLALAWMPRVLAGSRLLQPLERALDGAREPDPSLAGQLSDHVIVAGLGVGGRAVVAALEAVDIPFLIVELNPLTANAERQRGRRVVFGDIASPEVLAHAGLERARAVVLVVSDSPLAHQAVEVIRRLRPELPVILRTRYAADEGRVRAAGVDVVSEEFAGALAMADRVLSCCGIEDAEPILDRLAEAHRQLGQGDEGSLGPPPTTRWLRRASGTPRSVP